MFATIYNTHHCLYCIHTHPAQYSPHHQEMTDKPQYQIRRLQAEREKKRGSWTRISSITLCFSLQSPAARRLTHSLRDTLDISQCGKCGWIPNENRSCRCFINCCYYQHFQIPPYSPDKSAVMSLYRWRERKKTSDCHCSSVTVHFPCNGCEVFFFRVHIWNCGHTWGGL